MQCHVLHFLFHCEVLSRLLMSLSCVSLSVLLPAGFLCPSVSMVLVSIGPCWFIGLGGATGGRSKRCFLPPRVQRRVSSPQADGSLRAASVLCRLVKTTYVSAACWFAGCRRGARGTSWVITCPESIIRVQLSRVPLRELRS